MLEACDWLLALGAGSCAVGGILLYAYRSSHKFLMILKDVEEFQINEELLSKLDTCGGVLPYVGVSGVISADENVFRSPSFEGGGVIRRTEIREHKAAWNSTFENWAHQEKKIIAPRWELEPFSLVAGISEESSDTTRTRIHVHNPTSTYNELDLTTTRDEFHPSSAGFGDAVGALIKGEYTKGYQTIEQMLLVNTSRTIIGELLRAPDDKLVIRSPRDPHMRYYVTSGGVQTVVTEESQRGAYYRALSVLFFIVGGGVLLYWTYKRYKDYQQERNSREEFRRHQREMEEFDHLVDDSRICSICLTLPRDVVFLPCGHVCACSQCGAQLLTCPVCRGAIQNRSAIFFT